MACREFKRVAASLILLFLACVPCSASAEQEPEVRTASSRADTVSGGDVLVQLNASSDSPWSAQLDGRPAHNQDYVAKVLTGDFIMSDARDKYL
jgi:hypothetical protein